MTHNLYLLFTSESPNEAAARKTADFCINYHSSIILFRFIGSKTLLTTKIDQQKFVYIYV